ncbi:hypothetical protein Z517_01733 [Fonsecaea pedrosoi CBS 271.37]|uniref:Unplaced genomic scaffold supercont1.1, whole genome shotgun sequence n=1 Tax=Fonsecaea pedrosoi CBS 271.37 TaxID=1442368 RepID=A0A0D2FI31_9EURO|nr:uncharacterized protein Z517_01733 [Fonsecaea pedrosoi CBS 271.37]KIW86337.1 hypothetical protein Z517_01733 [Fonsecaea pedrosoi CBS 271.37]
MPPTNKTEKLPLTFGIEIEHVFGINKDAVETNPAFTWMFPQYCTIRPDSPNPPDFDPTSNKYGSFLQAVNILRSRGAKLRVELEPGMEDATFEGFSQWTMGQDRSVRLPSDVDELRKWSGGAVKTWRGWVFAGLELISPALKVPEYDSNGSFQPNGLTDVSTYLKLLTETRPEGTPYFFLSDPEAAGIHVHIGLQPQPEGQMGIPLNVLRHLAFICLAFEDTITLLHHPQRHANSQTYSHDYIGSNRFLGRLSDTFPRHTCTKGPVFSPEDAFLRIFRATENEELVELLTTIPSRNPGHYRYMVRECFVNFCNCFDFGHADEKRTVEFRQHHGTLEFEDISHWVFLVSSLARAAERKANEVSPADGTWPPSFAHKILSASSGTVAQPRRTGVLDTPTNALWQDTMSNPDTRAAVLREASKYESLFQIDKKRSLKELFDLLELPIAPRRYWYQRAKKFQAEWYVGWQGTGTCLGDYCPREAVRDNEGWASGELAVPPWDVADPHPSGASSAPAVRSADQPTDVEMSYGIPLVSTVAPTAEAPFAPHASHPNIMTISNVTNYPAPPMNNLLPPLNYPLPPLNNPPLPPLNNPLPPMNYSALPPLNYPALPLNHPAPPMNNPLPPLNNPVFPMNPPPNLLNIPPFPMDFPPLTLVWREEPLHPPPGPMGYPEPPSEDPELP